jgi:hypothetical protein
MTLMGLSGYAPRTAGLKKQLNNPVKMAMTMAKEKRLLLKWQLNTLVSISLLFRSSVLIVFIEWKVSPNQRHYLWFNSTRWN